MKPDARRTNEGPWAGLRLHVRQRLDAAVAHLKKTGQLRRADIQRIAEVSVPQASADIKEIKSRMPGLMEYDPSAKCYRLRKGSGRFKG